MTPTEKIKSILNQKGEYEVKNGKILRKDPISGAFKPVIPTKKGEYYLVKIGSTPEMFAGSDVASAIETLQSNGKPPEAVVDDLPIKIASEPLPDLIKGVFGFALPDKTIGKSDVKPDTVNVDMDKYAQGIKNRKAIGTIDAPDFPIITKNKEISRVKVNPKKSNMTKVKKLKVAKKALKVAVKKTSQPKKKAAKKASKRKNGVSLSKENIEFIKSEFKNGNTKMGIARDLTKKLGNEVSRNLVMYHLKPKEIKVRGRKKKK